MTAVLPLEGSLPPGLITPVQERLLTIIYGPEEDARALFEEWQAGVDMADLDDGCYRLYPYLYRRIRGFAPDHPFLGRLKGLFRRSLYRNHLLFQWARDILERLQAEGIDCIVLKGAALVRSIGFSAGFRPMADVDLLVRPGDARRAMRVADPLFHPVLDDPLLGDLHLQLRHGLSVMDDRRLEIDLHWRLSGTWASGEDPDAPFWETAEAIDLHGRPALALAPTELLYHVLVHGIPRNPVPTVRWISDSLDILAAEGERIDWPRFIRLGARYKQRLLLHTALAYLRARFGAAVPQHVLDALAPPYGEAEQVGFALQTRVWGAPIGLDEAQVLLPPRLAQLETRLPGRRRIMFLPDRIASPEALAWIRSLGMDHICEFAPQSPMSTISHRAVLQSPQWQRRFDDGPGALFRLAATHDQGDGTAIPVYASVRPAEGGKWALRTFSTTLTDWPVGAVVFRLDAIMGFFQALILGPEDVVSTPLLPGWRDFPNGAVDLP